MRLSTAAAWLINGLLALLLTAALLLLMIVAAVWAEWPTVVSELQLRLPDASHGEVGSNLFLLLVTGEMLLGLSAYLLLQLKRIVATVGGEPFTRQNAWRLRAIGWSLVAMQIVGIGFESAAQALSTLAEETGFGFAVSLAGLLAVLIAFLMAEVFDKGAAMADDLEGAI